MSLGTRVVGPSERRKNLQLKLLNMRARVLSPAEPPQSHWGCPRRRKKTSLKHARSIILPSESLGSHLKQQTSCGRQQAGRNTTCVRRQLTHSPLEAQQIPLGKEPVQAGIGFTSLAHEAGQSNDILLSSRLASLINLRTDTLKCVSKHTCKRPKADGRNLALQKSSRLVSSKITKCC